MAKMEAEIVVTLEALIIEDAILGERKRCAEVARKYGTAIDYDGSMSDYISAINETANDIAKAIEAGA